LKPVAEQGYLIVAINDGYRACAKQLAESLKAFHSTAKVCLLTDQEYTDPVFDYVHQLVDVDYSNPWANDWQVFYRTPFRETIKLEADMLIASPIDHWWTMLRHRDVVISTGCRNWRGEVSTARQYRQVFDANNLPDVYNAITYWRLSETARDFFKTVQLIFANWAEYRKLIKLPEEVPSTDLVYAMAAVIIGPEKCTMPFAEYPKIVHMKQHHAGTVGTDWTRELVWETDPLRINTVTQSGAFHYFKKSWIIK
jgi:hypothetical protein